MARKDIEASVPDTAGLDRTIRLLTAIKIIGKLVVPLIALFASVNAAFAVLDFLLGNIVFGIVNTVLAAIGASFLVGVLRHRRTARQERDDYKAAST